MKINLFDEAFLNRVSERLALGDTHRARQLLKAIVIINGVLILLGVLCILAGLPMIGLAVMALVLSEMGLARWLVGARVRAIAWWGSSAQHCLVHSCRRLTPKRTQVCGVVCSKRLGLDQHRRGPVPAQPPAGRTPFTREGYPGGRGVAHPKQSQMK